MNKNLFLYIQQKQQELLEKIKTKPVSEILEESKEEFFKFENPYMNIVGKTPSIKTNRKHKKIMGYISSFNVKLENIKEFTQEEKEQIKEDLMYITNIPESCVNYLIDTGETEFESKWYDREKELRIISKLHPNLKISIDIEGENREDYSKLFVFKGKTQTIKAVVSIMYEEDNKLWKD